MALGRHKVVKSAAAGRGLERVFITGVSSVVLSDATSGYNVAENVPLGPAFHDLCGFWEAEVAETLDVIGADCGYPPERAGEALATMRSFYNGYAFTYDAIGLIYNPPLPLPDRRQHDTAFLAAETFYQHGDLQPVCDFVEQRLFPVLDNRDYRWANEMTLKTAFLTLLFDDTFYIVDSEKPLARRYADMTLIVRPEMRHYQLVDLLLEFKLVKLAKFGLTREQIRSLDREQLAAQPAVQAGLAEARSQLQSYRTALDATYSETLRLRTYAVVGLGFERLVWEEVLTTSPL